MSDSKKKLYMRHQWNSWRLNRIHVLRGDSDFLYYNKTKELVSNMNIRVASVEEQTVNFLEELFSNFGYTNRRKLKRVSRDRKLLFLAFKNCISIKNALDVFYGMDGNRGKRDEFKKMFGREKYNKYVADADRDVNQKLISLIGKPTETVAYQTSLLYTEVHKPQEPHLDYDSSTENPKNYMVAFLPLTMTGQFLQLWETDIKDDQVPKEGELVFIPRGTLVLVPGTTLHGGGFRADHRTDGGHAHMRLHFYVYPGESHCMVDNHKNDYVDKRKKQYCNNIELESSTTSLNTTFFNGMLN